MFFHEIACELKTYMDPTGRGGNFVVALVGDTLRDPMTDEEVQMEKDKKFNPLSSGVSINMLDQIFGGSRYISKAKAGLICSRYDGQDFAEEIDNLYDADKEFYKTPQELGILGVEMESYGLFLNAMRLHKKALCILTVSDTFVGKEKDLTQEERQTKLNEMFKLALSMAD